MHVTVGYAVRNGHDFDAYYPERFCWRGGDDEPLTYPLRVLDVFGGGAVVPRPLVPPKREQAMSTREVEQAKRWEGLRAERRAQEWQVQAAERAAEEAKERAIAKAAKREARIQATLDDAFVKRMQEMQAEHDAKRYRNSLVRQQIIAAIAATHAHEAEERREAQREEERKAQAERMQTQAEYFDRYMSAPLARCGKTPEEIAALRRAMFAKGL